MFGETFSGKLVNWLEGSVRKALESAGGKTKLFTEKCIVCMEGPQFSTRAESLMYRQWGGDLINMSVLPAVKPSWLEKQNSGVFFYLHKSHRSSSY